MKKILFMAIAAITLMAAECNHGPDPVPVIGVMLDKETLALVTTDDPMLLTATVIPIGATNNTVTWKSSNTAVATVANEVVTKLDPILPRPETCVVTPKGVGTTTITVSTTDGGFTKTCTVTVTLPAATISNLSVTNASLTSTSAHITYDLDIPSNVYWMVYLASAATPDAITIKDQGVAVWKLVQMDVPQGDGWSNTITPLPPNIRYTLYMLAENANGFSKVESLTFATLP